MRVNRGGPTVEKEPNNELGIERTASRIASSALEVSKAYRERLSGETAS